MQPNKRCEYWAQSKKKIVLMIGQWRLGCEYLPVNIDQWIATSYYWVSQLLDYDFRAGADFQVAILCNKVEKTIPEVNNKMDWRCNQKFYILENKNHQISSFAY